MFGSQYGFDENTQRRARSYLFSNLGVSLCKAIALLVLGLSMLGLRLSIGLENLLQVHVSERARFLCLHVQNLVDIEQQKNHSNDAQ